MGAEIPLSETRKFATEAVKALRHYVKSQAALDAVDVAMSHAIGFATDEQLASAYKTAYAEAEASCNQHGIGSNLLWAAAACAGPCPISAFVFIAYFLDEKSQLPLPPSSYHHLVQALTTFISQHAENGQ